MLKLRRLGADFGEVGNSKLVSIDVLLFFLFIQDFVHKHLILLLDVQRGPSMFYG